MKDLRDVLKSEADIVLFDSPPVTALSDTAILSTQMDGVLLVVDAGKTRRDIAKRALEALNRVNAHVIGVLLNRMPTQSGGYYYYYQYGDYYGSSDGSGAAKGQGKKGRRSRGAESPQTITETPQ